MRVVIAHNAVAADAPPEERDVLDQVAVVEAALGGLGHAAVVLPIDLDLAAARRSLVALRPDVVVNLVESLGGSDALAMAAAGLFDLLGLPYTGSPSEALFLSGQKLLAKAVLRQHGLPTPDWAELAAIDPPRLRPAEPGGLLRPPCILKTVSEHASFGLDDAAVVSEGDAAGLAAELARRAAATGRTWFAERYVAGREFNLSLLAEEGRPQVLPAAEIEFVGYPAGKPRIVGYAAKWASGSAEYRQTPRRFDLPSGDAPLVACLGELAVAAWDAVGAAGYARVDFRVDEAGQPWILEVNCNPCLAPDAGFAAALAQAGLPFSAAVARLLAAARQRFHPAAAGG